ncbi:hypothetical protein [Kineococcus sp. SYSU DK004]|uniref:hypothetical protein n=1 Tax=Kineococcus sp. SYSU DK004 TaxID=3383125 RepID=UPI003D7CE606
MSGSRLTGIARAAVVGAAAGAVGAGVMAAGEKGEQALTRRPSSYVPGRTLLTLLGRPVGDDVRPAGWNHAMHYATGAALGALRGVWSVVGLRGPRASAAHTLVRLSFDQTLENGTGAGAPPRTWPVRELLVDVGHKAVFSFVTGALTDRLLRPGLESARGRGSH